MVQTCKKYFFLFCGFFSVFILHRFSIFKILSEDFISNSFKDYFFAFMTGACSDFLVASILAMVCSIGLAITKNTKISKAINIAFGAFIILFCVLLASHYGFVKFFHHPISYAQIKYIFDAEFVSANWKALFSVGNIIGALAFLFLFWFFKKAEKFFKANKFYVFSAITLVCLAFLAQKIRHKISYQLFFAKSNILPKKLEYNLFEYIIHNKDESTITAFNLSDEAVNIAENKIKQNNSGEAFEISNSALRQVQKVLLNKITQGDKPLIVFVLMESMRFYDTALGAGEAKSLTPSLDKLALGGIAFKHAYSTGTVTRGAQEALFCGYPGSQNLSVMRNRKNIQVTCLPELLETKYPNAVSFWMHGGNAQFDTQGDFFTKHQTKLVYDKAAFTAKYQSEWGIPDLEFLELAAQKLQNLDEHSTYPFALGMLLTVSNHSPWIIPEDAPLELLKNIEQNKESEFGTIKYSDYALGDFVALLKQNGLWKKTFLIVTGDHGQVELASRASPAVTTSELLSHVPLVLSGGIMDEVIALGITSKDKEFISNNYVSQVDIFASTSKILELPEVSQVATEFFNPFRRYNIWSDLADKIYFPAKQKIEVISDLNDESNNAIPDDGILSFQYFLHQINKNGKYQ